MMAFREILAWDMIRVLGLYPRRRGDIDTILNKMTSVIKTRKASLKPGAHQFQVSLPDLERVLQCHAPGTKAKQLLEGMNSTYVTNVSASNDVLQVDVNRYIFCRHVVEAVVKQGSGYGYAPEDVWLDEAIKPRKDTVVVEFSSPNIAKPFHAGHLRSTIIGNFVANLNEALGHDVHRLNYLGDWGTQFGLLLVGFERYGNEEQLEKDALHHLFQVYVNINQDVERERAEREPSSTYMQGLEVFRRLEAGDPALLTLWEKFQKLSWEEYEQIYKRLGVHFTDVHRESMFHKETGTVVDRLRRTGLLESDESGVCYVDVVHGVQRVRAKVLKSDGASLYLSRDIAAALHRRKEFKFNRIHYVAEAGQSLHFKNLESILAKMGESWAEDSVNEYSKMQNNFHVEFGRVHGMSTRRGKVVFLKDILDEARSRVLERMNQTNTTRVRPGDREEVADQVGVTAVVVQDLKERRRNDYTFSWDRMLNLNADSGLFLQYCHARLYSVFANRDFHIWDYFDAICLGEDIALALCLHLSRYPEVVKESFLTLEAYPIVQYLFQLGHLANNAYRQLPVKGVDEEYAQARMQLFIAARITLANGLALLGTKPLNSL